MKAFHRLSQVFYYFRWWVVWLGLFLCPTGAFAPPEAFVSPLLLRQNVAISPRRPIRIPRKRFETCIVHSLTARAGGSLFEAEDEPDGWTPDNYERDRETLARLIHIATERTRPQSMNAAFDKRRIDRGLVTFARTQLLGSLLVAVVLKMGGQSLHRLVGLGLALHGWMCIVLPPLVVVAFERWNARKYKASTVLPIDTGHDTDQKPFYPFWNRDTLDASRSGHNFPLCLAELWCSAVVGWILATMVPGGGANRRLFTSFGWLTTRLGVWSALHQYPEQWWHLKHDAARPITFPVYMLRFCTSLLWTRWMVLLQVAQFVTRGGWSWRQIGLLYGSCLTLCLGGSLASAKIDPERLERRVKSIVDPKALRSLVRAILFVQVGKTVWRNATPCSATFVDWWLRGPILPRLVPSFRQICWFTRWTCSGLAPACHIVAALRLLRIQYTSENALVEHVGEDSEEEDTSCTDTTKTASTQATRTTTFRYSLKWRKPRRFSYTLRTWRRETLHWLYFGGQVIDQLNRPERYDPQYIQHLTPQLKQRIMDFPPPENNNRTEWVALASNDMAKRHEANYGGERKDPLGIYVWGVFGVGLNYDFVDHMLPNGTSTISPSIWQTRLAKSAIERTYVLRDVENFRTKLNATRTEEETKRLKRESRAYTEAEIEGMAATLLELVPVNEDESLELELLEPQFKRVSSHEYLAVSDPATEYGGIWSKFKLEQPKQPVIVQGWFEDAMSNITAMALNSTNSSSPAAVDDTDYLNPGGQPATNDTAFVKAVIEDRLPSVIEQGNRTTTPQGNSSGTGDDEESRVILA